MKDSQEKQMPNFALDSSYVLCSSAKQPPEGLDKFDEECFTYYRILHATEDNNGVFGNGSAFIRDIDCVPNVNLDPFTCCQSEYYASVLETIVRKTGKVMEAYKTDSKEYAILYNKFMCYQQYIALANQQKGEIRQFRNYPCVLELLDRWFNTYEKVRISNMMTILSEARELQEKMMKELEKALKGLREQWWGEMWWEVYEEERKVMYEEKPATEVTSLSRYVKEAKKNTVKGDTREAEEEQEGREKREKYYNDLDKVIELLKKISCCIENMESWLEKENGELGIYQMDQEPERSSMSFHDLDEMCKNIGKMRFQISGALEEVGKLMADLKEYEVDEKLGAIEQGLRSIYNSLDGLYKKFQGLKEEIREQSVVTEKSFLVCRCGGSIKIVENGGWVERNKEMLAVNIVKLLSFAENYIYDLHNRKDNSRKFTWANAMAFNVVHGVLLYLGGEEASSLDYLDESEAIKEGKTPAYVEISVEPLKDVLRKEKNTDIVKNGVGMLPNWIGTGCSAIFSFSDVVVNTTEHGTILTLDNINPGEALINIAYSLYRGDATQDFWGDTLSNYSNTVAAISILQDIVYKSYAAFVGEIKISVTTFFVKYKISGRFDINGEQVEPFKASNLCYQTIKVMPKEASELRTIIHYKIYENGIFEEGDVSK